MRGSRTIRNAARLRDRGLCCNCGQHGDHTHHIVPLSIGGQDVLSNVVTICADCHGLVHGQSFGDHKQLSRAGQAKAREQGKAIGRPRSYRPEQSALVADLRDRGLSVREVARLSGLSRATVGRILNNAGRGQ